MALEVSLEPITPKSDNWAVFPVLLAVSYNKSGYLHELGIHLGIILWGVSIKFEWPI